MNKSINKSVIERNLIKKELYDIIDENNFFHDYYLKKIRYSIVSNKFSFVLADACKEYCFHFKDIFRFTCTKDFFVTEKYYDDFYKNVIPIEMFFKPLKYRHLLYIRIEKSSFNNFSTKYLNKTAIKVELSFDFGYDFVLDCKDFAIQTELLKTSTKK